MRGFAPKVVPLALAVAVGCGAPPDGHSPAAQSVEVAVAPGTSRLEPGRTAQFAASVTGTADTSVLWDVVEGTGGSVDAQGLYTAPGAPGTFHVRATSRAAPAATGQGTVTVVAPVSVAISPRTISVVAGGTATFAATVSNAANGAVTWSVPGTGCGAITQAGVYTAPPSAASCSVVATSQADPSKSDTAAVTVTAPPPPVVVTVTPSPAAVDACRSVTLGATVTGTANSAVAWSVQEGAAGGTVTAAGVYTAPTNAGTYHVVATSQADPARSAVAPVAVSDRILSVAVTPQTVSVPQGGTSRFAATVTTTCGAFASVATLNSAGQIVAR